MVMKIKSILGDYQQQCPDISRATAIGVITVLPNSGTQVVDHMSQFRGKVLERKVLEKLHANLSVMVHQSSMSCMHLSSLDMRADRSKMELVTIMDVIRIQHTVHHGHVLLSQLQIGAK